MSTLHLRSVRLLTRWWAHCVACQCSLLASVVPIARWGPGVAAHLAADRRAAYCPVVAEEACIRHQSADSGSAAVQQWEVGHCIAVPGNCRSAGEEDCCCILHTAEEEVDVDCSCSCLSSVIGPPDGQTLNYSPEWRRRRTIAPASLIWWWWSTISAWRPVTASSTTSALMVSSARE